MGLIALILVGAIAGWLVGRYMTGNGLGLVIDMIIGVFGGLAGGYFFSAAGFELGGVAGSLLVVFAGAALLVFLFRLMTARRRRGRRLWS